MGRTVARAAGFRGGVARGDVAILRFLAAVEILESDLWQQYNELALGNGLRARQMPSALETAVVNFSNPTASPAGVESNNRF